ncbi:hypothetical protein HanRHA438_Chr04g0170361 [Helianthus annuus]|nr:hypothetical protein HanIR_Chr04g0172991 [Helianthus annuus]KAJ0926378.1 hypothetical protein HanRHA438_Chr04g0170361 [Helianthus annuus]
MSNPSTTSPKAKIRNKRLTTGPCPLDTGAWSAACRKDKAVEASTPTMGACPAQHGTWSTLRYAEFCKILVVQIRFCPRGRAR